jgi:hypothetical protein
MPKLPECVSEACRRLRCLLYSHNPHLICTVHPSGVDGNNCLDFRLNPNAEPEGASYYNGELILQPRQHLTIEEKLELLDTHPIFTGCCPNCGCQFPNRVIDLVHFDCPRYGWIYDSVERCDRKASPCGLSLFGKLTLLAT